MQVLLAEQPSDPTTPLQQLAIAQSPLAINHRDPI
jgi:hypothetical protein